MGDFLDGLDFRIMSMGFFFRDLAIPREKTLEEAGLKPGFQVLDYGCGRGSYSLPAAAAVGESGKVYALDVQPLALRAVLRKMERKGIANIEIIESDCSTGLPDGSVDLVLFYDIFHMLDDPGWVLKELNRVLKPGSILSASDHHMKEADIVSGIQKGGLFELTGSGKKTCSFRKTR
ncbi:MAG: class I SAM-dependent methyltransferase [Actinomycetota bacterium]|nr:class I SAM-dependent methyltransferase [Actinomycetota bacterium]